MKFYHVYPPPPQKNVSRSVGIRHIFVRGWWVKIGLCWESVLHNFPQYQPMIVVLYCRPWCLVLKNSGYFDLVAMVTKANDWLHTGANVTQKRNNLLTPYFAGWYIRTIRTKWWRRIFELVAMITRVQTIRIFCDVIQKWNNFSKKKKTFIIL